MAGGFPDPPAAVSVWAATASWFSGARLTDDGYLCRGRTNNVYGHGHVVRPVIGADEAGKGPVLGPMVAAAVRCDPAALPADVDDSKQVAPDRREAIAAELRDRDDVAVGVGVVEPTEIDDPETDMNSLTVTAQARAIAAVVDAGDEEYAGGEDTASDGNPVNDGDPEVVVDAGDVSESRFGRRVADAVTERTARDVSVDAEHGADETYPIASAASIVAKVERDARVAAIDDEYPEYDVGSGYPSDPTTRSFLEAYVAATGEIPDCARRSWSTCEQVLAEAEQAGLDEF